MWNTHYPYIDEMLGFEGTVLDNETSSMKCINSNLWEYKWVWGAEGRFDGSKITTKGKSCKEIKWAMLTVDMFRKDKIISNGTVKDYLHCVNISCGFRNS